MRLRYEILATIVGLIAVPSSVLVFHFSKMPIQPIHAATATVIRISQRDGKFSADRYYIVVRNARGTGQFMMWDPEVRCHVGDEVPVQQRGITLTRTPKTCR